MRKNFVDTFVDGADDMIGVILVIAIARGASVLMGETYLDNYIIYNAADMLAKLPELAFVPLNYIFTHCIIYFSSIIIWISNFIYSIIAPIAAQLGYSVEVTIMTLVAANGLVNLITPTCGAIMGGLALAKVEYSTWFRWAFKVVLTIMLVNIFCIMFIYFNCIVRIIIMYLKNNYFGCSFLFLCYAMFIGRFVIMFKKRTSYEVNVQGITFWREK